MGRPRKPDTLRILHGDHPERLNLNPPQSPQGVGDPPDWLDQHGKEAWARLVDRVGEMKLLTRADHDILMVFATAYSDFRNMSEVIAKDGLTVIGGSGGQKPHPLITPKQHSLRTMVQIMGQLGMSPSSRASLNADPPRDDDPFMDHIRRCDAAKKQPPKRE